MTNIRVLQILYFILFPNINFKNYFKIIISNSSQIHVKIPTITSCISFKFYFADGPVLPGGPGGPFGPITPGTPTAPYAPRTPGLPVLPVGPVKPVSPLRPTEPVAPVNPTKTSPVVYVSMVIILEIIMEEECNC